MHKISSLGRARHDQTELIHRARAATTDMAPRRIARPARRAATWPGTAGPPWARADTRLGDFFAMRGGVHLVTGATDGIGLATAHQLCREGHTVLVHGRAPDKVSRVVSSLRQENGDAHGYVADLSVLADVRKLGAEVGGAWPRLDGLLNNAGSFDGDYTGGRLLTPDGNEYTLAVNVLAPFLLTSLLLPSLRASEVGGRCVIASSVSMGAADALDDLQLGPPRVLALQAVRRDALPRAARALRLAVAHLQHDGPDSRVRDGLRHEDAPRRVGRVGRARRQVDHQRAHAHARRVGGPVG